MRVAASTSFWCSHEFSQSTLLAYLVATTSGFSFVIALLSAWIYGLEIAHWASFVALVASSLAKNAEEPAYVKVERPAGHAGRLMSGVFLGTIPDYATSGVKGVAISGVVKGGPAEKAGLTGGDVIVGLAGQNLENIYDYMRALNGLKPGEEVGVTVLRGGEEKSLRVTPGVRR